LATAPFSLHRPSHSLAADENITEVWLRTEDSPWAEIWYSSGVEVHISAAEPNDPDPLSVSLPPEVGALIQIVGVHRALVIPPGVQGLDQPGSVTIVIDGVLVSVYGWLPDITVLELVDVAATVA
jgi:hypothetical protein